jgi:PAT family beta-lactamase induction signal transducer AmpG
MFWNLGKVLATGMLVSSMESLSQAQGWSQQTMWMAVWITAACAMVLFAIYHVFLLPTGSVEDRPASAKLVWDDFLGTATTFFHKRAFWGMIAFVFFYRIGEGLILTEGKLFLQSSLASGGLGLSAGQVSNIDAVYGTIASIVGGILGGLFLGKMGLKRSLPLLGLCLNIPHFTFVYLSHYAAAGHGLSYSTIAVLVSIEKFGYGFGFIGNMVYMMQQIAPGRSTMTHYAFATALMNLMLGPTTMISGPLAETLGYSTFFLVVMFASVPSVLAAWRAPFPIKDNDHESADGSATKLVTVDDPTRLSIGERTLQLLAGRASIYAMLNILTILVIDMNLVGYLIDTATGNRENWGFFTRLFTHIFGPSALMAFFGLLVVSAFLKICFSVRTFRIAGLATKEAAQHAEENYSANARGAKIATFMCAAATMAVLAFGVHMAF